MSCLWRPRSWFNLGYVGFTLRFDKVIWSSSGISHPWRSIHQFPINLLSLNIDTTWKLSNVETKFMSKGKIWKSSKCWKRVHWCPWEMHMSVCIIAHTFNIEGGFFENLYHVHLHLWVAEKTFLPALGR